MITQIILISVFTALVISTNIALAEEQKSTQNQSSQQVQKMDKNQANESEQAIYGWQLMSAEERAEHRAKMRSLKTREEREAYRKEHHEQMQARAKQKGLSLPDRPVPPGRGLGPGGGRGFGDGRRN